MNARELEQMLSSRQLPPFPQERLKRMEAAVIADLKPVRPLAPDGAYLAGLAAIFVAVCAMGAYFVGPQGWQALSVLRKIAVFLQLTAATALLVFSLVRQMRPAAKHARSSALLSAALFILLLLLIATFFQAAHETAFVRSGLVCFRTGMKFAIPAAFLFALLLHRGAALSPALTGAAAGGLAGLAGLAVLEIHCPNFNVYHIVVWHVAVTLACVAAGLVFSSVTFRRWTSNH
jgi:hypothetical protein